MLKISNLPSNLCPDWLSPDSLRSSLPPPLSLVVSRTFIHTTAIMAALSIHPALRLCSPASLVVRSADFPPSPPRPTSIHHLSCALLSQMLGGQDWPFAGPSLRHHGGGAWARCLVAYSCSLHHVNLRGACSSRLSGGGLKGTLLQTLAGLFGVILSLLLSPTTPPPPP